MQLRVNAARVCLIEVRRQQAQQEGEGFGSRCSPFHGPQHLSKKIIDKGRRVGGRGLVRGYSTHERFLE